MRYFGITHACDFEFVCILSILNTTAHVAMVIISKWRTLVRIKMGLHVSIPIKMLTKHEKSIHLF